MKKAILMVFILFLVACNNDAGSEENTTSSEEKENLVEETTSESEIDIAQHAKQYVKNQQTEIESDELSEFVETFNELASLEDEIGLIEDISPAVENEDGFTQNLYNSSDYVISATYDQGGDVKSYIVGIPADQPYQNLEGNGLFAMLHVGQVLGIDLNELAEAFENSLPEHAGLYTDDNYTVTFSTNDGIPEIGMIVMFMNLGE